MECPICFNIIINSMVTNCTHHYCNNCILKWCYYGKNICPVCKTGIYELKYDKEFDSLNKELCLHKNIDLENIEKQIPLSTQTNLSTKKIYINFSFYLNQKIRPGITISTNDNGPGVKVIRVTKKDIMNLHNIKSGDIILFINKVPCTNHNSVIDIIENFFNNKKVLELEILTKD